MTIDRLDAIALLLLAAFFGALAFSWCRRPPKHERISSSWKPPEGDRDGR